jgi:Na+-transporting NADH:ubiquinone oxidoreductase subunit C
LTFYEHGETPGLGGEIQNENWKAYWHGKKVYDPNTGEVNLQVVTGKGEGDSEIYGLSGATITSQGVSNMIKYWMGPEGFGPYIDQKLGRTSKSDASESKEVNEESKVPASQSKEAALQSSGGNQHG